MPDIRMLLVDPGSLDWYIRWMRLGDSGIIPTITPKEFFPSRRAMAAFFGPKTEAGWTFHNHGDLAYEAYVRELLRRVLQINWPLSGVMPFHFARGLVAEALGAEVSWAEFAYRQTHPHQSRSGGVRILPQFSDLKEPLYRLTIELPNRRIPVRYKS